ncbi:hypothetical protein [Streptomyces sp. AP-93]|uniref:hypothetical protein n=1 Tax=Streptomyces sp. AP-93 TaxID=2929048 RepID=UPI001FAFBEBA|nr:hypothetical protein [Streptomyces sp. AP-93]
MEATTGVHGTGLAAKPEAVRDALAQMQHLPTPPDGSADPSRLLTALLARHHVPTESDEVHYLSTDYGTFTQPASPPSPSPRSTPPSPPTAAEWPGTWHCHRRSR